MWAARFPTPRAPLDRPRHSASARLAAWLGLSSAAGRGLPRVLRGVRGVGGMVVSGPGVERSWECGEFARAPQGAGTVLAPEAALWAARSVDGDLWRLTQAAARADRELARGLAALWERELYRPLGYAPAIDFVREHVGIQERRARWLARRGRLLALSPELDRALSSGRLSASDVIELGAVVEESMPAEERERWIERAAGLSFRALQKLVRQEQRAREAKGTAATEPAAEGMDPAPAGGWMVIPAPARVGLLWRDAVALVRAAAGQHLTQGQSAELIFAEYLAGADPAGADPAPAAAFEAALADVERERLLAAVMAALNAPAAKPKRKPPACPEAPPR